MAAISFCSFCEARPRLRLHRGSQGLGAHCDCTGRAVSWPVTTPTVAAGATRSWVCASAQGTHTHLGGGQPRGAAGRGHDLHIHALMLTGLCPLCGCHILYDGYSIGTSAPGARFRVGIRWPECPHGATAWAAEAARACAVPSPCLLWQATSESPPPSSCGPPPAPAPAPRRCWVRLPIAAKRP
jgi:hypothetical protein